jgi:hypothetical protein
MSKGYQDAIANAFKQAQEERQAAGAQGELATLAHKHLGCVRLTHLPVLALKNKPTNSPSLTLHLRRQ